MSGGAEVALSAARRKQYKNGSTGVTMAESRRND